MKNEKTRRYTTDDSKTQPIDNKILSDIKAQVRAIAEAEEKEFGGEADERYRIKKPSRPWRLVTSRQVERTIEGTSLAPLVRLFESPMCPRLPLQVSLPKALVMAGCALCGREEKTTVLGTATSRGINLARLKLMTANGQACNVYALIEAPSGSGKDIGSFADVIALSRNWLVGNSGSAEGLADALSLDDKGNGYLAISEFSNWLDKRHWQAKAASFLTDAFNRGWFSMRLSSRSGTAPRESKYCYPSILANIQPAALSRFANTIDIETGFLSRFIISKVPDDYFGRPVCGDFEELISQAQNALNCYAAKEGNVEICDGYLPDLCQEFLDCGAQPRSHWGRLVNEYGPRFAVMLSVPIGDDTPTVTITDEAWRGAATMIRWFYSMAESAFSEVCEDEDEARWNRWLRRVYNVIKTGGNAGVSLRSIATNCKKSSRERTDAITELQHRGLIDIAKSFGNEIRYKVISDYE